MQQIIVELSSKEKNHGNCKITKTMSLPVNGKYVVRGEMNLMITALRRGAVRWNSNENDENSVLKQFVELKKTLDNIVDLREIHPNVFLNPFLELIRTDQTTGAVTSLALVAVNKFLSYGLIGE